jgi:hypothetical protein
MLQPHTMYRGLYGRVAKRLGVDASYVSRVARGERYSRAVETALRSEIESITEDLNALALPASDTQARRSKGKRLNNYIKRNTSAISRQFLAHSEGDHGLRSIPVSPRKRTAPLPTLLAECMKLMVFTPKQMRTKAVKAATQHGRGRRISGYRPADLVEEYNLIRRCIFTLAEQHFSEMDPHMLFHDMSQIDEALDLQLQNALTSFLSAPA